jgi:flavin reductase (DIM6/NTAB) family NADH-FMN oxidoreductase RutF
MKKDIRAGSLLFPNPVLVVCTYDTDGKANAATLAWGGVASSEPPAISIAVQPVRYTYEALLQRKAFTVNLVPAKYAAEADYFGMISGRNADKFSVTGLTPTRSKLVDAPYIEEFPYALECEVTHTLDLGRHTLFVGEIKGAKLDEDAENLWSGFDIISWNAATREYFLPGASVGGAFSIGKKFL